MKTLPGRKAVVIGFGSIGQRHARILGEMGLDVAVVSRRALGGGAVYASVGDALARFAPHYAVIATETTAHGETLAELEAGGFQGPVLIEKPLFADPLDADPLGLAANPLGAGATGLPVYVGYNLRHHPVLGALKARLADVRVLTAEIACASYLPAWRPGRDLAATSSARKDMGGGVLRDVSHEIDFAAWLLGRFSDLTAHGGTIGSLDIETEDAFMLLARTRRCALLSVALSYLEHGYRRTIIVSTDENTFVADLAAGRLTVNGETVLTSDGLELDNTYRNQHLDVLSGTPKVTCSLAEGLHVVDVVAAAEQAARSRNWVTLETTRTQGR